MSNEPNPTQDNESHPEDELINKQVTDLMGPAQQIDSEHTYEKTPITGNDSSVSSTDVDNSASSDETIDSAPDEPESTPDNSVQSGEDPSGAAKPVVMKMTLRDKISDKLSSWWNNLIIRYTTIGVLLLSIGVVVLVPAVRYGFMNLVGVRTSISVTTIDSTTLMPLKNVVLSVGKVQTKTNDLGKAKLYGVKLGNQTVIIHKAGFADNKRQITFEMRTVDLGEVSLVATGLQYRLSFTDYLSGKSLQGVSVESGEATATSDGKGVAVITIPPDNEESSLKVVKTGYRTETLDITKIDSEKTSNIPLVYSSPEVFIEKASGTYNVSRIDIDGKNHKTLLTGTGRETPDMDLSVDPSGKMAALVSTRDDNRNSSGYLLQTLTLIDTSDGSGETLEHAEYIKLIGWNDTTLLYLQTVSGTSAANPNRQKIMAYDYSSSKRYQIASANGFSGIDTFGGKLYYIVSSTDPAVNGGLFRSNFDGTGKTTLYSGTLWAFARTDYKTLALQTPDTWYNYLLGEVSVKTTSVPSATTMRRYLNNPNNKVSVWTDDLHKTSKLSLYDTASGKDRTIDTKKTVHKVTRWIGNDAVVYQTESNNILTDWIISIDGGDAKQLSTTAIPTSR